MSKRKLKTEIAAKQDGLCAISGVPLETDVSLIDTDRIEPKMFGGTYTEVNTRVAEPRAHMERHGILREREPTLDVLKSLFDDRVQMMKLSLKENNQILAYERRVDSQNPETLAFLKKHLEPIQDRIAVIDSLIAGALKVYPDKLAQTALKVKGLGPITVAALTVYIDFSKQVCWNCRKPTRPEHIEIKDKSQYCSCTDLVLSAHAERHTYAAATISSLWKYVGLHTAAQERYTKGEAGGGNKTLRTVLWNAACVMLKLNGGVDKNGRARFKSEYRDIYDQTVARLSVSDKIVETRNTQGKLVESAWKDTKPSHRHGAALRKIMKQILADYWVVGRTLAGLPTRVTYAEEYLGHEHQTSPIERGWVY